MSDIFLKELLGNMNLQVSNCEFVEVDSKWGQNRLIRDFSKLYYFISGEGKIVVDGKLYRPGPGDCMLIPGGVPHSFRTYEENRYVKHYCHFDAEVNGMNVFELMDIDYLIKGPITGLERSIKTLTKAFGQDDSLTSVMEVKACLYLVLSKYLLQANCQSVVHGSESISKMGDVAAYIKNHLKEPLTNEVLAEVVHLHPNYFAQQFKSVFGLPPNKYLVRQRIQQAKMYLLTTEMSIQEVASEVGFANVYYFSNTFKKITDMNPTSYRRTSQ